MKPSTGPRWKLLFLLIALPLLLRAAYWLSPWQDRGWSVGASIVTAGAVLLLAIVWLLFLSRLPWQHRLGGLLVLALLALGLRYSVRVDGHMGDYFPQLAWTWSPKPGDQAGELQVTGASRPATLSGDLPGDFPNFLGPNHNNWVPGSRLAADWYRQTPRELWRRPIGLGWSAFSVAGPYAFTMEQREDEELTVCYEARTGTPIWAHAEEVRFSESMGGDGPRSTPTIHEENVYALGATGILLCLDGLSGAVKWRRDTLADAGHGNLTWGKSGSPLIVKDTVVITLGDSRDRSLAAYDLLTGELRWRAGQDSPGYATPVAATLAGKDQLVIFNASSVSGHEPDTGAVLWSYEMDRAPAHNASPVIIDDNKVLVGVGYGRGARLLEVQPGDETLVVSEVWHSMRLKPKFADMVLYDDHVYGLDEGRLVCLQPDDGRRAWRGGRYGHGQLLGIGDKLLIQAESGEIVIAEASPTEENIVHRFEALSSKTWNHPVLAGRLLLLRNDREAVAYEYPGSGSGEVP